MEELTSLDALLGNCVAVFLCHTFLKLFLELIVAPRKFLILCNAKGKDIRIILKSIIQQGWGIPKSGLAPGILGMATPKEGEKGVAP